MEKKLAKSIILVLIVLIMAYGFVWKWLMCRTYIPPDYLVYINSKIGNDNPNPDVNRVVDSGIKGIQKIIYGEGRYFINPLINDTMKVHLSKANGLINPLEVGIVESLSGEKLPEGEFLVKHKKNQKGILKDVLTPGKWKLNPRAYRIKKSKAVAIEAGFVGCVTSLAGKPIPTGTLAKEGERGVMAKILQPGIYYMNPSAYRVEKVEIGYRQISFTNEKRLTFKSKDGFDIELEVSVVWGVLPEKVPYIIERYGNIDDVVTKVIKPQVDSLCRIEGSKYGAVELIEGKTREIFQNTFTSVLEKECERKDIKVLIGLIRNITIPEKIRAPIQESKIAQEEIQTKKEESETQKMINTLEKLKEEVKKGIEEVKAGTDREVATILAKGNKEVAQIRAEQEVEVAELKKEIAKIQADITRLLGTAKAKSEELQKRAEADLLTQNIKAIGGPEAYAYYTFANKLPEKLKIFIRYAGEGTLWTDLPKELKNIEKIAGLKILKNK